MEDSMTDELKAKVSEGRTDAAERTGDRKSPELTTASFVEVTELGALETEAKASSAETESIELPSIESMARIASRDAGVPVSSQSGAAVAPAREESTGPLFSPDEAQKFRARWDGIQTAFVDEPRDAVKQADSLVSETMKRLAEVFSGERAHLEKQAERGGEVSTEDLRVAFRRYRSFFGRLLSV
jgi:hypothetical protein